MKNKKINQKKLVKGLFAISIAAIMIFSLLPAMTFATNTQSTGTTDTTSINTAVKANAASSKITWSANGGKIGKKAVLTTTVTRGKKIGRLPAIPKRTGYAFQGWYTRKSGGTKITTNTIINKNTIYYAQWAKIYKLSFDANGGTVSPTAKNAVFKKAVGTLPTPKRTGYTFTGWYTAKTGGTKFTATTLMPGKNVKLFAQWTKGVTNTNPNRVLTAEEKKLLGKWFYQLSSSQTYMFNDDGTYTLIKSGSYDQSKYKGTYSLNNGILTVNYDFYLSYDWGQTWKQSSSGKFTYKLTFYTEGEYQRFDQEYLSGPILVGQNARYYRYVS
jgi:uncharacterized repeat protein (TIGR02543 family)